MSHYNGCGCGGHTHNSCNSCTSHNEIQQAVNDALAFEKENLEQYQNNAAQSATDAAEEAAKAAESASAAAQSQTNAETAAGTATQAASSVTNTAIVLEETAERLEQAQDLLEEQISALQTKPVYFEVSTPTSSLVLPETETVFNVRSIYVASVRQALGYGFTFDKETRTVTLAKEITADQIAETEEGYILVEVICDVYSSDDPTSFPLILASNAGATNVGTSTGDTVETRLTTLDSQVDPTLRQNLASGEEGMGGDLVAYKSRTVSQRLSDKVTLTDYPGAVEGRDNDSTAAFVAAYATGRFVYVPAGDWSTSVYIPNQTFGEGRVWSSGDGLFPDAGERVITPGISHQRQYLYRATTWGNRERAAGWSLMVNNENGRPSVSGFANDNAMANYVNFDHVGFFVSMRGSRKFFYTTAANTTYTESTITAPEITSGQEVEPGMLISTSHSPRFKGRVMAVDFDTNTITVSKWVAEGNGANGQIPASGVRALINGADKLWAGNFNLFIDANSPAKTACGLEIDIISDGSHGNPVEGYTVSNANNLGNPFNYGFRAIGNWLYSVYADAKQNVGLLHVEPPTSAVRVDNLTSSAWAGSAVLLNTNYRQTTSYLAKIITGGVTHFSIDSRGQRSVQREAYGVISTDATLTGLSPGEISCTNATATTITLTLSSTNCVTGQKFNIRATDGPVVVAGFTLNLIITLSMMVLTILGS